MVCRAEKRHTTNIDKAINDQNVDHDNYERHMNIDLARGPVLWGIPCGVGNSDYGFVIEGAGRPPRQANPYDDAPYPVAQALTYNFLIRNTHITKDAYPQYMPRLSFL